MSYSKIYYQNNKEKYLINSRKWLAKKPIKRIHSAKKARYKYSQTSKGIYLVIQGNARRKGRTVLPKLDFIKWYDEQEKICYYCLIPQKDKRLSIDRKNNSLGYISGNLALACYECNKVKGDILSEKEMLIIGKTVMKKRWQ